jgi:hypothetical protein
MQLILVLKEARGNSPSVGKVGHRMGYIPGSRPARRALLGNAARLLEVEELEGLFTVPGWENKIITVPRAYKSSSRPKAIQKI